MADVLFPGYATVKELLDAGLPGTSQIPAPMFLGQMYNTLLNDHNLTEDKIKHFFIQFIQAIMKYKVHLTELNPATNTYDEVVYPPAGSTLSNYATDYFTRDRRSGQSGISRLGPINQTKKRRSAMYHTRLSEYLEEVSTKYPFPKHFISLDKLLTENEILKGIENRFNFPNFVRAELRNDPNGLGGANLHNLRLCIVPQQKNNVLLRFFIGLYDPRLDRQAFETRYTSPHRYSGTAQQVAEDLLTDGALNPTLENRGNDIIGRVMSGLITVYYETPPGELGHLDVIRLYGGEYNYKNSERGAKPLKTMREGNIDYIENIHYATKSSQKFKSGMYEKGQKVRGDYFLGQTIYPSDPAQIQANKTDFLSKSILEQETELIEEDRAFKVEIDTLTDYLKIYNYRIQYFKNVPDDIFSDKEIKTDFDRIKKSYEEFYTNLNNYVNEASTYFKAKEKHALAKLKELQAGRTVGNLPIRVTDFVINYKKELEEKVTNLYNTYPVKMFVANPSSYTSRSVVGCHELKDPLDLGELHKSKIFTNCSNDMHYQLLLILNENFTRFFTSMRKSFVIGQALSLDSFQKVVKYASIQTISASLTELLETYVLEKEEETNDRLNKNAIFDLFIHTLNNLDFEYSIINKGEEYIYDFSEYKVPIHQRRLCLLLNLLYDLNDITNKITDDLSRQKGEMTTRLTQQQRNLTTEFTTVLGIINTSISNLKNLEYKDKSLKKSKITDNHIRYIIVGKLQALEADQAYINIQLQRLNLDKATATSIEKKDIIETDKKTFEKQENQLKTSIERKFQIDRNIDAILLEIQGIERNTSSLFATKLETMNSRYNEFKYKFVSSQKLTFSHLYSINTNKINDLPSLKHTLKRLYSYHSSFAGKNNKALFSISFYISLIRSLYKWTKTNVRTKNDQDKIREILRDANEMLMKLGVFICTRTEGDYFVGKYDTKKNSNATTLFLSACPPKDKNIDQLEKIPFDINTKTVFTSSNAATLANSESEYSKISNVSTNKLTILNKRGGSTGHKPSTRKARRSQKKRTRKTRKD